MPDIERPLVTPAEIARQRMIVEDGPDAPLYPAGAYEFAAHGLAEPEDTGAGFVLVDVAEEGSAQQE